MRRGPYPKGQSTRARILDVAMQVFSEEAYVSTSVRVIADRCGITPGAVLHHFRTKQELFLEILRRRDQMDPDFVEGSDLVGVPRIVSIVRHNADTVGLVRLYVVMSSEAASEDNPAREYLAQRYERLRTRISDELTAMKAIGSLDDSVDPESAATNLIAAADGLQVQWLIDRSIDMASQLEELARAIGVQPAPSRAL